MEKSQDLLALLPKLKNQKIILEKKYLKKIKEIYISNVYDMMKLHKTTCAPPKALLEDSAVINVYCQFLIQQKQYTKAESLLRKILQKKMDDESIMLYGLIPYYRKQFEFVESLIKKNPLSSTLYLCLGKLSMSNELWGKAKKYLKKSLLIEKNTVTFACLGKLYEQLNDNKTAYHLL